MGLFSDLLIALHPELGFFSVSGEREDTFIATKVFTLVLHVFLEVLIAFFFLLLAAVPDDIDLVEEFDLVRRLDVQKPEGISQ